MVAASFLASPAGLVALVVRLPPSVQRCSSTVRLWQTQKECSCAIFGR